MASTADYDAPRNPVVDLGDDSVEELKVTRSALKSSSLDVDEAEGADGFALPGADTTDEELTAPVVPMKSDEFRCSRCFLVHHRSQLVDQRNGEDICQECA